MIKSLILTILLAQLSSDDFRTRETAHARLLKSLPAAGPYLLAAKSHKDPEIASRARHLFDQWAWQAAEKWTVPGWPCLPWIDSLPHGYPDRYNVIRFYSQEPVLIYDDWWGSWDTGWQPKAGSNPPDWTPYRAGTKKWIYDQLKRGTPPAAIREVLQQMLDYEADWITRHQHAYQFPQLLLHAAKTRVELKKQ